MIIKLDENIEAGQILLPHQEHVWNNMTWQVWWTQSKHHRSLASSVKKKKKEIQQEKQSTK